MIVRFLAHLSKNEALEYCVTANQNLSKAWSEGNSVFYYQILKAMSEKTLDLIKVMGFFKFSYIHFTNPALCTASKNKNVRGKLNK